LSESRIWLLLVVGRETQPWRSFCDLEFFVIGGTFNHGGYSRAQISLIFNSALQPSKSKWRVSEVGMA